MTARQTLRSAALEAFLAEVAGALPGATMRRPSADGYGKDVCYSVLCEYEKYTVRIVRMGEGTWVSWWVGGASASALLDTLNAYHLKLASSVKNRTAELAAFRRIHTSGGGPVGYDTAFDGRFTLSRELTSTEEQAFAAFLEDDDSCQWRLSEDRAGIEWDGAEKFYRYVEHAQRIAHWFRDRGMAMTGRVAWHGESRKDHGVLLASDGLVAALPVHVAMSAEFRRDDIPADELRRLLNAARVPGWNKTWALR